MKSTLKNLLENKHIQNFDFPAYYHKRGTEINERNSSIMPMYPPALNDSKVPFELEKSYIKDLIFDKRGYSILWYLNAIHENGMSILDFASPLFAGSNKVTRGGINTYKQNGWMVHVLYVFQLITYNIPTGTVPSSFRSYSKDLKVKFQLMNEIYWKMDGDSHFLLRVLALIHDIGVVDGVQNHDKDGEKYVSAILQDLDITSQTLINHNIKLQFDHFVELLRILVANHTLINKISSEDSDSCIQDRVLEISNRLSQGGNKKNLNFDDLASIFLLLGMADLIAVDDCLFTTQKFKLAYNSYIFLNALFSGQSFHRDIEQVALMRLHEMLPENVYVNLSSESNAILKSRSICNNQFWESLYHIYKFEYSIAYLKPLKSLEKVILVLSTIFETISKKYGSESIKRCIIRFDASINSNNFIIAVDSGDFSECCTVLSGNNIVYGRILNMSTFCGDSTLLFTISDK